MKQIAKRSLIVACEICVLLVCTFAISFSIFLIYRCFIIQDFTIGGKELVVVGTDTVPGVDKGLVVYLDPAAGDIDIGDLIFFESIYDGERELYLQQVVGIRENGVYHTEDKKLGMLVNPEDVVGKYAGKADAINGYIDFSDSFWGIWVMVLMPAGAVLLFEMHMDDLEKKRIDEQYNEGTCAGEAVRMLFEDQNGMIIDGRARKLRYRYSEKKGI